MTIHATLITSILISVPCPTIVQWDTINYNQATLLQLKRTHLSWMLWYAYYEVFDAISIDAKKTHLFILLFIYISIYIRISGW